MTFLVWLEETFRWVQESPSILGYPTILTLHTFGLTLLVGPSLAIDLKILGAARGLPLAPFEKYYPVMMTGFWINVVTGLLLFAPEATRWAFNSDFLLKMALVITGVVVLYRIRASVFRGTALRAAAMPAGSKALAASSLVIWVAAIFAGRMSAYVDGWNKFMALFKVS